MFVHKVEGQNFFSKDEPPCLDCVLSTCRFVNLDIFSRAPVSEDSPESIAVPPTEHHLAHGCISTGASCHN